MTTAWRVGLVLAVLAGPAVADDRGPPLQGGIPNIDPTPPQPEAPAPEEPAPAEPAPAEDPASQPRPSYDRPVFQQRIRRKEIVVMVPGARSRTNKLVIGSLAVTGGLLGALGAYFNVDARSAADEVSASTFTGRSWTAERDAKVDRAERSSDRAAILYGIGGALVVAAAVTFIVTEPESKREVLRPHVAVGPDGAVVGGAWSW